MYLCTLLLLLRWCRLSSAWAGGQRLNNKTRWWDRTGSPLNFSNCLQLLMSPGNNNGTGLACCGRKEYYYMYIKKQTHTHIYIICIFLTTTLRFVTVGGVWRARAAMGKSVKIRRTREPLIERININDRVGMEIWKSKQDGGPGCIGIPNLVRQYGPSCCWFFFFFLTPKSFPRFLLLLIPTCSYNKIPRRVPARVLVLLLVYIFFKFFFSSRNIITLEKFEEVEAPGVYPRLWTATVSYLLNTHTNTYIPPNQRILSYGLYYYLVFTLDEKKLTFW
jgi:hypothetical protein